MEPNNKQETRTYRPYWNRLKKYKKLVVDVGRTDVFKIRKALYKEKDEDIEFKLFNLEQKKSYRIKTIISENAREAGKLRMTFVLELRSDCVE